MKVNFQKLKKDLRLEPAYTKICINQRYPVYVIDDSRVNELTVLAADVIQRLEDDIVKFALNVANEMNLKNIALEQLEIERNRNDALWQEMENYRIEIGELRKNNKNRF